MATETTVDSSYFETDDRVRYSGSTITPIGRPFANVRYYILDRWQLPVPICAPGEICIGGLGVSKGYINQPELTAERFLPDPFHRGGRMFRTGDMGRLSSRRHRRVHRSVGLADQALRGQRVEIGEIEALLSQHPWVKQTAIVVDEPRPGGARAWWPYVALRLDAATEPAGGAAAPGSGPDVVEALRASLAAKLPDYMGCPP